MRGDDLDAEFSLKMVDPDDPNEPGTAGITGPILESWESFLGPV